MCLWILNCESGRLVWLPLNEFTRCHTGLGVCGGVIWCVRTQSQLKLSHLIPISNRRTIFRVVSVTNKLLLSSDSHTHAQSVTFLLWWVHTFFFFFFFTYPPCISFLKGIILTERGEVRGECWGERTKTKMCPQTHVPDTTHLHSHKTRHVRYLHHLTIRITQTNLPTPSSAIGSFPGSDLSLQDVSMQRCAHTRGVAWSIYISPISVDFSPGEPPSGFSSVSSHFHPLCTQATYLWMDHRKDNGFLIRRVCSVKTSPRDGALAFNKWLPIMIITLAVKVLMCVLMCARQGSFPPLAFNLTTPLFSSALLFLFAGILYYWGQLGPKSLRLSELKRGGRDGKKCWNERKKRKCK